MTCTNKNATRVVPESTTLPATAESLCFRRSWPRKEMSRCGGAEQSGVSEYSGYKWPGRLILRGVWRGGPVHSWIETAAACPSRHCRRTPRYYSIIVLATTSRCHTHVSTQYSKVTLYTRTAEYTFVYTSNSQFERWIWPKIEQHIKHTLRLSCFFYINCANPLYVSTKCKKYK